MFPDGLPLPLRWRLHLLSHSYVHWLGLPPPLVLPLAGASASAIATCQTGLPPTNVLLNNPIFATLDLIWLLRSHATLLAYWQQNHQKNLSQVPTWPYYLVVCTFRQKRNLFLQVTARSVRLFLEVPVKKKRCSFFFEPTFLRILGNSEDSCRNAQPSR